MASRDMTKLAHNVYVLGEKFLVACEAAGVDLLVTCTLRSDAEQMALYAQGRGRIW